MLGQHVRRWRSTEAADYKITPASNIILNIYEPEPAASITQKYIFLIIDIFKREIVCQHKMLYVELSTYSNVK